jgi:hypothetical protein
VQKIAVRCVDLDHLHARFARHPGRVGKLTGDIGDLTRGRRVRIGRARMKGNRAGRKWYPAAIVRRNRLAATQVRVVLALRPA